MKTCQTCNTVFEPTRSDALYCGTNCRSVAYRKRGRTRNEPVGTVITGANADLIRQVCRLYAPAGTTIHDLTWGNGSFWRKAPKGITITGSDPVTRLDAPYSLTDTPYPDESYDVVTLDPPYQPTGQSSMVADHYQTWTVTGMLDVMRLYDGGLQEAQRLARRQVWVKCQDQVHAGEQHPVMVDVVNMARDLIMTLRDTFVLVPNTKTPAGRWDVQHHARKRHSYLLVFDV